MMFVTTPGPGHRHSWSCGDNTLMIIKTVFTLSLRGGEVKLIWSLYKSELSGENNGPNDPNRDGGRVSASGWGWSRDFVQTERQERRGTFWMKTNVKTIKAIFPLINSPHWLLGLLSPLSQFSSKWMRDEVSVCNWIWIRWPRKHRDWCTLCH